MLEISSKTFTVTEISLAVKEMLEGVLADVRVQGEISGLKKAASGHVYFDLKDENALISAVMFKGFAMRSAPLRDGLKVLVRGDLSCYIKQGRYQIIVKTLTPLSAGDLYLEFEKLKQKLQAEGLFEEARKKPLPEFARKIAVVTSPTGAAVRDILTVLKRRSPNLEVIIAPTLVQGEGAAQQIAAAIKNVNKLNPAPDVILAGRGGGSMEDLWCFNEEIVARAIAASKIQVISCVGHETDFTIADFVADLRAPTPSAAAEIVVQNSASVRGYVEQLFRRMINGVTLLSERAESRIKLALSTPFLKDPLLYLNQKEQQLDDAYSRMTTAFADKEKDANAAVTLFAGKLNALSPRATLKRGFSITRKGGVLVKSAAALNAGDILETEVYDGKFISEKK